MVTKPTEGSFVAIMRQGEDGPEILLAEREDGTGWGLIGGGVEPNETPESAAIRETLEESRLIARIKERVCPSMTGTKDDRENEIHFFAVEVVGGTLQRTEESLNFAWVRLEDLASMQLSPFYYQYPDCPQGVVYGLAKKALMQENPTLSNVPDPDGLAVGVVSWEILEW